MIHEPYLQAPAQESLGRVITLGETMALVSAASQSPFVHAKQLNLGMGGAESNVAIGLARLGVPVTWVGRIGADFLGELVAREIRAEGVDTRALVDSGAPTGLMLKGKTAGGKTSVAYYRKESAGSRLSPADVPVAEIERAQMLHLTGITPALSDSAREAVEVALEAARRGGTPVSFDVNYRSALWSHEAAASRLAPMIAAADVVFAGEDEAAMFVGEAADAAEYARRLLDLGAREAVVKCGPLGAVTATAGGVITSAPAHTIDVVDTVGAGDAFVAGYLSAALQGADIHTRLQIANATGACACTALGDWEGAARAQDMKMLLNPTADPVAR
jgi:2-dehydro-3-deoxygluconokinase